MLKIKASDEDTFLALDIGGTNVNSGLVGRTGEILSTETFPTKKGKNTSHLLKLIIEQLKSLWSQAPPRNRPKAVAIGAPGWIKPKEGLVVVAPNIKGWKDIPITKIICQALELPTRLENDANLYALGEWLAGAGRGYNNQITVTLGTGVGGGLILNGRLWSGSFSSAAEIGHISLGDSNALICGCGRQGCLETVASAKGMTNAAKEWLMAKKETLYSGSIEGINPEIMKSLAEQGDPMSLFVFRQAGKALGQILCGIFNLLGLETAVIGGGASGAYEHLIGPIKEVLKAHLVTATLDEIKILPGLLLNKAPLVGAAALLDAEGF
ncbi:MAG: ROK family protein [Deltaproteobacteria bacterium]|jgi:glucokinase|nr:ROK family protein [Deltaproteobacteria bacterium]